MTKHNKEKFENKKNCRFCEKEIVDNRVRDHCHLTGKNRGPAHNTCNINIKQKERNFISVILDDFSNYDCDLFFKHLVDK